MKGLYMKIISSIISLSFLVLFLLVFSLPSICFSEPDSKVWEYFQPRFYYNKTKMIKSSNIISVWVYKIVTDDERNNKVESMKKNNLAERIMKNFTPIVATHAKFCFNRPRRR